MLRHSCTPATWTDGLTDRVDAFLSSLRVDDKHPAHYLPCREGATATGRRASLGNCCFAVKTLVTLGLWHAADAEFRQSHIDWIRSFQDPLDEQRGLRRGAFVDPVVRDALRCRDSWGCRAKDFFSPRRQLSPVDRLCLAETKLACATLHEIGAEPRVPYSGLPRDDARLRRLLERFDWTSPWDASDLFSCVATLLTLGNLTDRPSRESWHEVLLSELDLLADPLTGAYFTGQRTGHEQLIHGAMKVLSALSWLDEEIHFPKRLIDTCLQQPLEVSSCQLAETVYVLHQCHRQTHYRAAEIVDFAVQVLERLVELHLPDGGFSYSAQQSQTTYRGARIAHGLPESDLHTTWRLTWAIALCERLLGIHSLPWNVIRP